MPKIHVTKSIVIDAPIDQIYASVRDFKQWSKWSPWAIAEPDCPMTYAADGSGYSWNGKIIGSGGITIASESAPHRIDHKLQFLKPFRSKADVYFTFTKVEGGVEVTWAMDSSLPFFLFFMKGSMETFIGMDYTRGLMMLKSQMETGGVPSKLEFTKGVPFTGRTYVGVRACCSLDKIGENMQRDVARMKKWRMESSVEIAGQPFSIYHSWNATKKTTEYTIGYPVVSVPSDLAPEFVSGKIPEFQAYTVKHTGPYPFLSNAWSAGMMHARGGAFKQDKKIAPFEVYENNPEVTDPNALVTVVHFGIK